MTLARLVIFVSWIAFVAYWSVTATGVKKSIGTRPWKWEGGARVVIVVVCLLALRRPGLRHGLWRTQEYVAHRMALSLAGAGLCALGIGLAIWARVYLGQNWGFPMSRKENPELVTSGPYAYARHPIYTGLLAAMLGSAIGATFIWSIPLAICAIYFVHSARVEEKLMLKQFPEQYPAYMRRTKMLLPFIV